MLLDNGLFAHYIETFGVVFAKKIENFMAMDFFFVTAFALETCELFV